MTAIPDPPPPGRKARFAAGFGCRYLVTVDTTSEFASSEPATDTKRSLDHVPRLAKFQEFCEGHAVVPIYLVDWPVAISSLAVDIMGPALTSGRAEIGLLLQPRVNPPFDDEKAPHDAFEGELTTELEAAKFRNLRDMVEDRFGIAPLIYRAGGQGAGPDTTELLIEGGLAMDTSVRAKFDFSADGGPDYRRHPVEPYWLDAERRLLEMPLTTVFWGMLRRQGDWLHPWLTRGRRMGGLLAYLGLLERIPLTPHHVSVEQAIRGIDIAIDDGLPILVFSFQSSSLQPGRTPFVRDEEDLDALYGWWRRVLSYCELRGVEPTNVAQIMQAVER